MTRLIFAGVLLLVAAVVGIFVLDHVPWLLPWAVIALILGLITAALSSIWPVGVRVALLIAAAAAVIAAVTWAIAGGAGLTATPATPDPRPTAAQVLVYQRQHTPPRPASRGSPHDAHAATVLGPAAHPPRPKRALAAARLYGVKQLGRWHWQRIILGWSLLLGAPLALLGIAAGLGLGSWRAQAAVPPSPSRLPGAGRLRTAGRSR